MRFQVTCPVELERGTGITRNVSASGIFFETDQSLSPGEPIRLTLGLHYALPQRTVRLRCQGQTVRVEQLGEKVGVAMAIESFGLDIIDIIGFNQS